MLSDGYFRTLHPVKPAKTAQPPEQQEGGGYAALHGRQDVEGRAFRELGAGHEAHAHVGHEQHVDEDQEHGVKASQQHQAGRGHQPLVSGSSPTPRAT